ncbi:glycoside hydrolase family 36 protein [Coraliomargarita parva]|uniref:glycoside hydrolase family 36 protein n=1 Tax=Coraliomargarita parva TaxID=3014050 RepID=UPI0022B4F169|nr:glycoside hydrolase family 36 protein [Coraliomargarita parva]
MNTTQSELNGLQIVRIPVEEEGLELRLSPLDQQGLMVPRRPDRGENYAVSEKPDRMVQVKLSSDSMSGMFLPGITMQDSMTTLGLKSVATEPSDTEGLSEEVLTTSFITESGLRVCQHLAPTPVEGTLISWTTVANTSDQPLSLELLSSFVLSGITPYAVDDAPGRLKLHRFRSWWSNEGRHECVRLEDIHLIRNWHGNNQIVERFGQVGTMPVRKFFPFVAIEDTEAGVLWGAQLAWAGSWQIEVTRRADSVSISGGLADFEFGHWKKALQPGERFKSPKAHIACVSGGLADLTGRLVQLQEALLPEPPECEKSLPVVFNEWCTNWGSPSHDKTLALARRLQGSGVKYIVIDDGWAKRPPEAKMQSNGDWILDTEKFPHGMRATCDAIREMGFIPGVWFEFEVCNPASEAFRQTAHHLQRDGEALSVGSRRFWDLNDPWVVDYLDEKLIGFLKENGFGYLKVDYNDTFGVGCDHADSLGEGLRHHVEGIHRYFKRIKDILGEFVIENCSSGGHRLEPSMMALSSMSSFSDAHESMNIPIIARQLHHLMPPRQSQIWAVLYTSDSPERFMYSLTATFYGRMCLSGPVHDLSDAQVAIVHRAVAFYESVAMIIREGVTHYLGDTPLDWMEPDGWSGICRLSRDGRAALVVIHEYKQPHSMPREIALPLSGQWALVDGLSDQTTDAPTWDEGRLHLPLGAEYRGYALHLERR